MTEPKYNIGDKFILEITEVDQEAITQGYPKPTCLVQGMNGAFSENVLDKLERIEPQVAAASKTNGDKIRTMTDEELAVVIMCPYDTVGEPEEIMPCVKYDNIQGHCTAEECKACIVEYLQRECNG